VGVVRIVTDSTAAIPAADQQAMAITVVPLNVHFGDQVFRDGIDLSEAEFFTRLKASPRLPTTSQPSVGAFDEVFRPIVAAGDEVLSVHLSAKLSGTFGAARMAADAVDPARITVVDSGTVAMAMGFLVLEAARLARQGAPRAAITQRVEHLIPRARVICTIDTLTYLERGGRIGRAQALLGALLNVKPLLGVRDGEVMPLGRARSRAQALDRLVEILQRDGKLSHLAVLHGGAENDALKLRERVASGYPELTIPLAEIGPVIGTHTGPGVIGFTYLTA
jgi:fatty acid kinase fatty acid binding subunit